MVPLRLRVLLDDGVDGLGYFAVQPDFAATASSTDISLTGDTSSSLAWQYSSTFLSPLLSLTFDGTAAGIYFDRAHSGPGTPGSGTGADIVFGPLLSPPAIVVTYSSAVELDGNPPVGDLYARMEIDFADPGLDPQDFAFTQPIDAAAPAVPEPASAGLFLGGISLLALCSCHHTQSAKTLYNGTHAFLRPPAASRS